jgi:hypothetical protein
MAELAASLAADVTPDAAPDRPRGSAIAAITSAGPVLLVCEPRDSPDEP